MFSQQRPAFNLLKRISTKNLLRDNKNNLRENYDDRKQEFQDEETANQVKEVNRPTKKSLGPQSPEVICKKTNVSSVGTGGSRMSNISSSGVTTRGILCRSQSDESAVCNESSNLLISFGANSISKPEDLSYVAIADVVRYWEYIRCIHNYEEVIGSKLLQNLINSLDPLQRKTIFDINENIDVTEDYILRNHRLVEYGKFTITLIEQTIDFLGPDMDDLFQNLLHDIHCQLNHFGIDRSLYPKLLETFFNTIRGVTDPNVMNVTMVQAWTDVLMVTYDCLMSQGNKN